MFAWYAGYSSYSHSSIEVGRSIPVRSRQTIKSINDTLSHAPLLCSMYDKYKKSHQFDTQAIGKWHQFDQQAIGQIVTNRADICSVRQLI